MAQQEPEYLTTKELAELLRIKERKVYDLASNGQIPCSRALGKLLFPRQEIEAWLARGRTGGGHAATTQRPAVMLGSYEPLLEWALRESNCGLATLLDGSLDGLDRFARGEGVAAGLHVYDAGEDEWNVTIVEPRFNQTPVALIEWAWRDRGLIVQHDALDRFDELSALRGARAVPRQASAGTQVLFECLIRQSGIELDDVQWTETARTETDAALAVLEGRAEVTLGLRAMAEQLRLAFVPVLRERYDILVDRSAWFEPPLQRLFEFCRGETFRTRAAQYAGYDISGLGTVRYNAE